MIETPTAAIWIQQMRWDKARTDNSAPSSARDELPYAPLALHISSYDP